MEEEKPDGGGVEVGEEGTRLQDQQEGGGVERRGGWEEGHGEVKEEVFDLAGHFVKEG